MFNVLDSIPQTVNLTIVECKYFGIMAAIGLGFVNLTIVECKYPDAVLHTLPILPVNLTIVECKFAKITYDPAKAFLLI